MKKTLAVVAALIAGVAAIVVLGLFSLQRMTPDAPPYDDSALRPKASAPGPDDAFPDFETIAAKLNLTAAERDLIGKQNDATVPDFAAIEPLIARNEEALQAFAAFARRGGYTDPDYTDPAKVTPETPVRQYFPLVAAAKLTSLRAAARARDKRAPEALEEALRVMDSGQVLLRSEQTLIAMLVGALLEDTGAKRVRAVIEGGGLDKAALLAAARRLGGYRDGGPALQGGLRNEYLMLTYPLDHMAEYAVKGPAGRWYYGLVARSRYFYQPQRTRALYAGRFAPLVEDSVKPCLRARPMSREQAPVDARPNTMGRVLFNYAMPAYDKLFTRRCETDFRVAEARTAAAVAAYRLDKKRLPPALADLVPAYLPAVPLDPFTGEALLYAPETGAVHSAGKDVMGNPL